MRVSNKIYIEINSTSIKFKSTLYLEYMYNEYNLDRDHI